MRTTYASHGTLSPEHLTDRIGELRALRERAHEQEIDVFGKLVDQVLETRIANEANFVASLFAPDRDYLRHDARKIRVHQLGVERTSWPLRHEIYNAYAKLAQHNSFRL